MLTTLIETETRTKEFPSGVRHEEIVSQYKVHTLTAKSIYAWERKFNGEPSNVWFNRPVYHNSLEFRTLLNYTPWEDLGARVSQKQYELKLRSIEELEGMNQGAIALELKEGVYQDGNRNFLPICHEYDYGTLLLRSSCCPLPLNELRAKLLSGTYAKDILSAAIAPMPDGEEYLRLRVVLRAGFIECWRDNYAHSLKDRWIRTALTDVDKVFKEFMW